jgi:hypothetical protein
MAGWFALSNGPVKTWHDLSNARNLELILFGKRSDGCLETIIRCLNPDLGECSSRYLGYYYQYPADGFIVMTKILDDLGKIKPQLRLTVKKSVFQRLLFHITEQFDKYLAEEGQILTHLMMSQLLVLENARRPISPSAGAKEGVVKGTGRVHTKPLWRPQISYSEAFCWT